METRMVVSRLVGDYLGDESITILAREERGLKVFHLRTSNARPDQNLALKVDRYFRNLIVTKMFRLQQPWSTPIRNCIPSFRLPTPCRILEAICSRARSCTTKWRRASTLF